MNVAVGFGISTVANIIVLPWFGYAVSASDAAGIGGVLTIVSILRSYCLRRAFNWWHLQQEPEAKPQIDSNQLSPVTPIEDAYISSRFTRRL